MENNKDFSLREIDLNAIARKIMKRKKLFIINLSITFVVSCAIIFSVPRTYTCSVKLAPESTNSSMGSLGSLASTFGLNMGNLTSQDAIIPEFYPDVIESVDYTTGMFNVKVTSKDGKIKTNYFDYLAHHQKYAWWNIALDKVVSWFKEDEETPGKGNKINPFRLTKEQTDIVKMIEDNIQGTVDKKTDVITITVTDQDPLICATIADSARSKLQQFIIDYRTAKAKNDLKQALQFSRETREKYIKAQRIYAAYSDANEDVVLQSFKSKIDELENEMQLRYNAYQTTVQQVQIAQAKLQERTPAFTTLQSATVPIKPTGPKRVMFIFACLFLVFFSTSVYVCKKDI